MQTKQEKHENLKNKVEDYIEKNLASTQLEETEKQTILLDNAVALHELIEQQRASNKINHEILGWLESVVKQNAALSSEIAELKIKVDSLEHTNKKLYEKVTKISDCTYGGYISVK